MLIPVILFMADCYVCTFLHVLITNLSAASTLARFLFAVRYYLMSALPKIAVEFSILKLVGGFGSVYVSISSHFSHIADIV